MGVSKQDWKEYSDQWSGGECKSTLDELMQTFDSFAAAIDGDDANEFLAHSNDDGKLMEAATKASSAAGTALDGIQKLRLDGNQRRFANKAAIAANDAAIGSVKQYKTAVDLLISGLVRGVRLEHDQVEQDASKMASMKTGDLKERLDGERSRIQDCYDYAGEKVEALAAVEKIGVI